MNQHQCIGQGFGSGAIRPQVGVFQGFSLQIDPPESKHACYQLDFEFALILQY
jgi:hypothetical protein